MDVLCLALLQLEYSVEKRCILLWYLLQIQHLFGWDSPRTNLSAEDVLGVMRKKFIMRVDLERGVVEHVSLQEESKTEEKRYG